METNLSQSIELTSNTARYDTSIKELPADKQIAARILKYTLDEFKNEDIDTIMKNIGEPEISSIQLNPGYTNSDIDYSKGKIKQTLTEDNVPNEGKILFDIRFNAYYGTSLMKILVNVEAQKNSSRQKLKYQIDNRIIFYLSRMILAQKQTEFVNSDYDDIKPVKSIWICMDSEDDEDSISRISLIHEPVYGKLMQLDNLYKIQGILI